MFFSTYIHDSLTPAAWAAALVQSLRTRDLAPKFLYESPKQARRWLAVHERYSPARQDAHGAALYEQAAAQVAARIKPGPVTVIGLGCGGGQKEVTLLQQLRQAGHPAAYVPVDASLPLVLTAANNARAAWAGLACQPVVADLMAATNLPDLLAQIIPSNQARIFTFYGMLPNLEPEIVRALLRSWLRPGDWLLLSANLAPGADYAAGVRQILPQYDNVLMREWLLTWPGDLGLDLAGTDLIFEIATQPGSPELRRIEARLSFNRSQEIEIEGQTYRFKSGEDLRLFYSYRYTLERVRELLQPAGLTVVGEWITPSEEEGIVAVN